MLKATHWAISDAGGGMGSGIRERGKWRIQEGGREVEFGEKE